jgi:hypothetical protein
MRGKQFNLGWSEAFLELNARIFQSSFYPSLFVNLLRLIDGVLFFFVGLVNNPEIITIDQSKPLDFFSSFVLDVE